MKKGYNWAPIIGAIAGTLGHSWAGKTVLGLLMDKDTKTAAYGVLRAWSGINASTGKWDVTKTTGWLGFGGGAIVSKGASKIGLNRYTPKGHNF